MIPRSLRATLLLGLVVAILPTAHAAITGIQAPLDKDHRLDLDFVPGAIAFRPNSNELLVASLGNAKDSTASVSAFDLGSLAEIYSVPLPHTADAIALSAMGDLLYVVGAANGSGFASAIRLPRESGEPAPVETVTFGSAPVFPSAALGASGRLYIGDSASNRVAILPASAFAPDHDADVSALVSELFYAEGVRDVAVVEVLDLAFVSANVTPKVSAVRLGPSNRVADEYAHLGGKESGHSGVPLPLAMVMTGGLEEDKQKTSFLVADHRTGMLGIVDYDSFFETLDLVANTSVPLRLRPGSALEYAEGTKVVRQPVLLAGDARQKTILVANLYSDQLFQYARSPFADALERVAEIALPGPPRAIAVSPDGATAAIAIANLPAIQIQTTAPEAATVAETEKSAKVRDLQRALTGLGFNVGAVDGVQGAATQRALELFQKQSGKQFPLSDTDAALGAVQEVSKACDVSGLRCLLKK